jgi:hypothetical protein
MAVQISTGEPGQPVASGNWDPTNPDITNGDHGAVHCQPFLELFLGTGDLPPGSEPGVIVAKPNGELVLGAPRDGICAAVYASVQ